MSKETKESPEDIRSSEQIESDIARTRVALTATVDELASRLDPKEITKNAATQAKVKATEFAGTATETAKGFADKAKETLDDAKEGDRRAITILAGAAAAATGIVALIARRGRK